MDWDLAFVVGIVFVVLTIPAMISAFSDGRSPRTAAFVLIIGSGLLAVAIYSRPEGYSFAEIPEVFVRVVGRYIN